jgi:TolB protein
MKKIHHITLAATLLLFTFGCNETKQGENEPTTEKDSIDQTSGATKKSEVHYPEEKHLANVRQITFGGDNAEAYWSFDDEQLVVQITNEEWGYPCDQIFLIHPDSTYRHSKAKLVSTGEGRTTCSYFLPGDTTFLYASTHHKNSACPPKPAKRADGKYVWPVFADYDMFVANLNGEIITQLTDEPGYDAEATVSPQGDKIVFTSMRTGDLELYVMNTDGSDLTQITDELGYDGGAFFSPDGQKIVFRASRPKTEEEVKVYKDLLAQGLVQPIAMELFLCNADGSDLKQITKLGGANWGPFFHPSGEKVIFSSNHASEKGFPFNLYMVNLDGTGLERITYDGVFDAFPVFSNDGKRLVFSSNRNNGGNHNTNLFIADWVE